MIYDRELAIIIAKKLLEIQAVKINVNEPFTWASGWKSPIYCDNRQTLSFPKTRNLIRDSFSKLVADKFPGVTVIAGVATAGIPHGALIADQLNLPFIYVRSTAKGHGLQNKIEGYLPKNSKAVVIEDLISTGKSSLEAVAALRNAEVEIMGLAAIFTYNFPASEQNFHNASCAYYTLSDYMHLANEALDSGYIQANQMEFLQSWRKDPAGWGK